MKLLRDYRYCRSLGDEEKEADKTEIANQRLSLVKEKEDLEREQEEFEKRRRSLEEAQARLEAEKRDMEREHAEQVSVFLTLSFARNKRNFVL